MKNSTSALLLIAIILGTSFSCSFLKKKTSRTGTPTIDFTTPQKGLDVKVELDKTQTASGQVGKQGGRVSLTAADGSKFALDVPADAVDADTMITMTTVKSIEGSPLESSTPTAVQLEPSGLTFKQIVTLTITPSREIPIAKQIVFSYEGSGKEYHLAPVDPKSKEIKIKLFGFSGAGVGSGSDSAWAAHQMIEASKASTRLIQKFGEVTREERLKEFGYDDGEKRSSSEVFDPFIQGFIDQVVMKEIVAAELDCKHAQKALDDLIFIERFQQLLGLVDSGVGTQLFRDKVPRLLEIGHKCTKSYRVNGQSNNVTFTGEICNINKPFTIDAKYPGGTAKTTFFPDGEGEGQTTVTGGSGDCTHSGGGDYTVIFKTDGSGTLTWTTTDKIACSMFSNSRTATFTLSLQPAPEIACP